MRMPTWSPHAVSPCPAGRAAACDRASARLPAPGGPPGPGPGRRRARARAVRQARGADPHAGRPPAVHGHLHPKGHQPRLPDPHAAHALQRVALRRGGLPRAPGALAPLPGRGLHLRLPGRAGPHDVRGRLREHAAPAGRERRRRGREHRHLRHHRVAAQACGRPQRPRGPVGHQLSRLLLRRGAAFGTPGPEGRLTPGPHRGLVPGRRLPPQRRPLAAPRLQLHDLLREAPAGAHQGLARHARPRHLGRLRMVPAPGAHGGHAASTRRTPPSGTRCWTIPPTMPSGRPATCGPS